MVITFTLNGPDKIIGVGSGDLASHDPEQYVETSERVNIGDFFQQLSFLHKTILYNKMQSIEYFW